MFFALNTYLYLQEIKRKNFFNTYPIIYISGALHLFLKNWFFFSGVIFFHL